MSQTEQSATTEAQREAILQKLRESAKSLHLAKLRRHFAATIAYQAEQAIKERSVMLAGESKPMSDTPNDAGQGQNST